MLMTGLSLAGPAGNLAAGLLGGALNLTNKLGPNPTPQKIVDALSSLSLTPEQQQAIVQAEQSYQLQMAAMGYKDAADMEALAVQDRESARQREVAVGAQGGWLRQTPEIGFYMLIAIFALVLHWLLKWPVPSENRAIIYSGIGSLGTLVVMAATYFYGTTKGSEIKSSTIAQTASTLVSAASKK
jgi:hypothetical protein